MTAPVRLLRVGVGKETVYGQGAAPSMLLPVTHAAPADVLAFRPDTSWRGSAAGSYGHTLAALQAGVQLAGPVLADGVGHLLAGLLGDVTVTGAGPYTWVFALLNSGSQQPTSRAVTITDPTGPLQFPGVVMQQLQFVFDPAGLLTWQATAAALTPTTGAVSMPAPSAEQVVAGWVGAVQVGGAGETRLLKASVTITRSVVAKRNVTGVLDPYLQRAAALTVAGAFTVATTADTYRQQAVAGTPTSLDLHYTWGARQLRLHCSQVTLTQAVREYGGKWVTLDCEFAADSNTTDAGASGGQSPIKATLVNSVSTGY